MVARVARIRGNRLQIVTDELPENLSCLAILVVTLICRHRLLKLAPANTLVSTAAGVFSSPAPVVPVMPKTLL
jgi:hypothetical protein